MAGYRDEPPDDVDRLFARLRPLAAPPDLAQRIMRALPEPAPVLAEERRWRWTSIATAAFLLIMSLRIGIVLDDSGALGVLGAILQDFGSFLSSPGDYLNPLLAELPWIDMFLAFAALVIFWVSSSASMDRWRARRLWG
jgi:hypothetical protein